MTEPAAISGLDDTSQARIVLWQSKRLVHVPWSAIGGQPLDAMLTALAALVTVADRGLYFTGADAPALFTLTAAGRAILDDADAAAQRTTLGLGSAATQELTPWVAYTPTFTGFGTASAIFIESRRAGDTLHIRGKFTSGTSTAVEARMTLGFNGTNGNVTSDATKVPSIQLAGYCGQTLTGANSIVTLIESSIGYVTFGLQSAGGASLTKANGSTLITSGNSLSIMAEVPISGW